MSLFKMIYRKMTKKGRNRQKPIPKKQRDTSGQATVLDQRFLQKQLGANIQTIQHITGNSPDIIIRKLDIPGRQGLKAAVVMTDGLINDSNVSHFLIEMLLKGDGSQREIPDEELFNVLEKKILTVSNVESVYDWNQFFSSLLSGEAVILIDGIQKGLATNTRGGDKRPVSEPQTEVTIRGPREAFTESIRTNTALIRRHIRNPHLWLESMTIGKVSQTEVEIMYIKGIANDKIVEELKKRLKQIDTDHILESGHIEQFIEDKTFTFFPTIFHSERPDVVSANLLEGRVAVLVDGSPFVLTVPALFMEFFQSADDYYSRFDISIFIRFLRVAVFFISIIAPSLYIAVTTYHQEMIPTLLIVSIAAQREAIPFPAFVEAFIMEITFEILREAGVRLPRTIGQAVSIVGALVIGQAAVQAGIVSPFMVIIVAITAVASFATPSFNIAISARLLRFILMILSGILGFLGIISGLMVMTLHLTSLRSFGIPYMAPLGPTIFANLGDTLIRLPPWIKGFRPKLISQKNIERTGENQKPKPPKKRQ